MAPIVLQLQELASTSSSSVSDLLRKARMVASKLKLDEFNSWLTHELHDYPANVEVPDYRKLYGDLRAQNPLNGILMPVRFDAETTELLSTVECRQSIGSLEDVVSRGSDYLQV